MGTAKTASSSLSLSHVRDGAALTAIALLGPYLAHVFPGWDDTPLGARLLPLFYAPLLGVFWRRHGWTIALALASPWVNHLLFGMPFRNLALVLSFEVLVFALILLALVRRFGRHAWQGPAAYLLAKPFSAALIAATGLLPAPPLAFITDSVTTAWPGIIVLALLGWLARRTPTQPSTARSAG